MSIFIDELKNMKLYKSQFFPPIIEKDKKKGSAILLLTPNIDSSIKLMNHPLMINNRLFESYYAEKDVNFVINQESALVKKFDSFIHESINYVGENNPTVLNETMDVKRYIHDDYVLDENSLTTNVDGEKNVIFFNGAIEEDYVNTVLNESGKSPFNMQLRKILYDERIRSSKEAILLYDKVREQIPWIKKTYIDYKLYKSSNLFVDWSYYTTAFFKNNVYKLDKGIDLYFEFCSRFLNDQRLINAGYTKKTVFVPVIDWVPTDDTFTWDYTKNLNPISVIYRLLKTKPEKLKEKWKDYNFVFMSDSIYFKVDFNEFDVKTDLTMFITFIRQMISKEMVATDDDPNQDSPKAIVAKVVDDLEKTGITVNNLTGGTDKITPEELKKKLDQGLSSDDPEDQKAELVNHIQQTAVQAKNADEALDDIDSSIDANWVKGIITDLQSDEVVNINATRAARMRELGDRVLDKTVDNKSVRSLIEDSKKNEPLEETKIPIKSINEDWGKMKFINFGKSYDMDADIMSILESFGNKSMPLGIVDVKTEDTSTTEDLVKTWTVQFEDGNGKRFTVKFDTPKLKNNRFMRLRGNEKTINGQLVLLPIIKTEEDTVQIVTNYNKIFIRRYGSNIGKSCVIADRIIKALDKYTGKDIVAISGNNTKISSKYELPIDYIDLGSAYSKIQIKGVGTVYFNQDELAPIKTEFTEDEIKQKLYYMVNTKGFKVSCFGSSFSSTLLGNLMQIEGFKEVYDKTTVSSKYAYSKASILNTEIPVIVIMAYNEGLQTALKKGNIKYTIEDKRRNYDKNTEDVIRFKDGFLYYTLDFNASLLMNGLKECNMDEYSIKEMNTKDMWVNILEIFGSRIKADGLDNFYDLMIDPITAEICKIYKLPTDYISLLAYANELLIDNKFNRHVDITGNRMRENEIIAGYTYKVLADAYGEYKNQLKRSKTGATMSVKQSCVIDSIMIDPTASDLSILNPLLEAESANSISFKGLSGMNSDRSYRLDKRTYDDSMFGILGMSTGFAANVGISRQATIDSAIYGKRGLIKGKVDKNNITTTNALCITEALTPMGTTHDDPFRTAMTFIQTSKHQMPVKRSMPNLVTNGADEALAYLTGDTFAFKAKSDGIVTEVADDYIIISYPKLETKDFVDLRDNVMKNSDGGFFLTVKLTTTCKKGDKFKKGDILAYDKVSYSQAIGEKGSNDISYNIGTLAKIAIMNTDEGFEDSSIITEQLSKDMTSDVVVKKELDLPKNTNIYNLVKKGTLLQEGDPLLIFQNAFDDEDANMLLKNITDDEEAITDLGRIRIKSKITGVVQDVRIYRTVELNELSPSLKKTVIEYEKDITALKKVMNANGIDKIHDLEPDYKLEPTGKLKNAKDGVHIEIFLKYEDKMSVGDKLVYYSALKGVTKDIIPGGKEPYTDFRPNEKINSLLAIASVNGRMVGSIQMVGALNKVMVELDRKVKETMGLKWKTLDEM